MRIAHNKRRETFNLATPNAATAADKGTTNLGTLLLPRDCE